MIAFDDNDFGIDGFANAQAQSAVAVLAAVKSLMATYATTHVTLVGHSLGMLLSFTYSIHGLLLPLPYRTLPQVPPYLPSR